MSKRADLNCAAFLKTIDREGGGGILQSAANKKKRLYGEISVTGDDADDKIREMQPINRRVPSNKNNGVIVVLTTVVILGVAILVLSIIALSLLVPLQQDVQAQNNDLRSCVADGSCLGGTARFDVIVATGAVFAPNIFNGTCLQSINGVSPNASTGNLEFLGGANVIIAPELNNASLVLATTSSVTVTTLAVQQDTLLGFNTSCAMPMLPSCLDISGQTCTVPLASNCWPQSATFSSLTVDTLIFTNGSSVEATCLLTDVLTVQDLDVNTLSLSGNAVCIGGATISPSCFDLSGYTCPLGMPIAESCIPANMTFTDTTVTNTLLINQVQCTNGNPLDAATCLPSLLGDVVGPLSATVVTALQGTPISATPPTTNGVFIYDGSMWTGSTPHSSQDIPNTIVSRDATGSSSFDVVSALLVQSSNSETCLGLGNPLGANPSVCAKSDISLSYNNLLNVTSLYADNIFSSGLQMLVNPIITLYGNVNIATGSLWFANQTELSSLGPNLLSTQANIVTTGTITATHFVPQNVGNNVPTVVAGTGLGTGGGAGIQVLPGSTDCKMRITLFTGNVPAAASTIFTLTYRTAFVGTLVPGTVMSAGNANAAALAVTASPFITGEALTGFVLISNSVALAPTTQYIWNFQTCA
jgi:hypothetical protein